MSVWFRSSRLGMSLVAPPPLSPRPSAVPLSKSATCAPSAGDTGLRAPEARHWNPSISGAVPSFLAVIEAPLAAGDTRTARRQPALASSGAERRRQRAAVHAPSLSLCGCDRLTRRRLRTRHVMVCWCPVRVGWRKRSQGEGARVGRCWAGRLANEGRPAGNRPTCQRTQQPHTDKRHRAQKGGGKHGRRERQERVK
jgi:hypothetical protein